MLLHLRQAPYGINNPIDAGSGETVFHLPADENGIPFVRLFPGVPPPPPINLSAPEGFSTAADPLEYKQIAAGACKVVRIRNTSNRQLRVARSAPTPNPAVDLNNFNLHNDYATIAPKFFEPFACEDSNEFFVSFADGLGGAERIEIIRDGQV